MSLGELSRYNDGEDELRDDENDVSIEKSDDEQFDGDVPPTQSDVAAAAAKPKALVSYIGDYSDDDDDVDDVSSLDGSNTGGESSAPPSVVNLRLFDAGCVLSSTGSASPGAVVDPVESVNTVTAVNHKQESAQGSVRLPPEPEGRCSKLLQEKIGRMIERKNRGMNVNEYVQRKKEFRNPSIYEKLVSFIGIDEHGTNFPRRLYDPSLWGPESHYDNLAKLQKEHHDKKEKEKLKRTHVEFVTGTKKVAPPVTTSSSDEKQTKKTKWDQKHPVALSSGKLTSDGK